MYNDSDIQWIYSMQLYSILLTDDWLKSEYAADSKT